MSLKNLLGSFAAIVAAVMLVVAPVSEAHAATTHHTHRHTHRHTHTHSHTHTHHHHHAKAH
jgi:hypothetical protein